MIIHIKKEHPQAKIPSRATSSAAGMDLYAVIDEERPGVPVEILPGTAKIVRTGLAMQIPEGYEVQIRSRSGLAAKHQVFVLNSPGTIDSDYRGEVKVILFNLGTDPFVVLPGERIAQMVVARVEAPTLLQAESLTATERGSGGFGSTGTK